MAPGGQTIWKVLHPYLLQQSAASQQVQAQLQQLQQQKLVHQQQIATYGRDNPYTAEELNADITNPQPSREQFLEEVTRNMKSKETLMWKLFLIGYIVDKEQ